MDPLNTPPRDLPPNRRRRKAEDKGGVWTLLAIAAVLLVGILYLHRSDFGLGSPALPEAPGSEMAEGEGTAAPGGGGGWAGMGTRKPVSEPTLQMAKPIEQERYAAPVTHVTETDACRALRNSRVELRAALKKASGAERKAELEDELSYVQSRGTERGCWTGGAG